MQLFSADATYLKKIKFSFAHKKLKKPPSKVAQSSSNLLFLPYCPDCPNRRISAPKCGLLNNCIQNWADFLCSCSPFTTKKKREERTPSIDYISIQ